MPGARLTAATALPAAGRLALWPGHAPSAQLNLLPVVPETPSRMRSVLPVAFLLLLIGLLTPAVSAKSVQLCSSDGSGKQHRSTAPRSALSAAKVSHAYSWFGFRSPAVDHYPRGDCATECSMNPASSMHSCTADAAKGIPATVCKPLSDPDICPTLRYMDAVLPEYYCMPRFEDDCAHPDNIGCSARCILFVIVNQHCTADAYNITSRSFNASCTFCNMCWDRSGSSSVGARKAPYALLQARGETGALFNNHWLVLPKAACSGIESSAPGCTDAAGEYLWANAYSEALALGFRYSHGSPDWAVMLNAPNRRGVHQMHIHIAHFDSSRSVAGVERSNWLVRKLARAEQLSTAPSTPTRILGEGFYDVRRFSSTPLGRPPKNWARVYAVFVPTADPVRDLGRSIKPFQLARQLSAATGEPSHGYGLMLMPRKLGPTPGIVIGIVWSTDDWEQLDVSEMAGDPIGFSHTCHNYIGLGQDGALAKS